MVKILFFFYQYKVKLVSEGCSEKRSYNWHLGSCQDCVETDILTLFNPSFFSHASCVLLCHLQSRRKSRLCKEHLQVSSVLGVRCNCRSQLMKCIKMKQPHVGSNSLKISLSFQLFYRMMNKSLVCSQHYLVLVLMGDCSRSRMRGIQERGDLSWSFSVLGICSIQSRPNSCLQLMFFG